MRKILFRGMTKDKIWIFRHLFGNGFIFKKSFKEGLFIDDSIEILPDTVCQFTGFCDCNGEKIFEGDIVKIRGKNYVVEWNDDDAGFILCNKSHKDMIIQNFYFWYRKDLKIVGNIYENREI